MTRALGDVGRAVLWAAAFAVVPLWLTAFATRVRWRDPSDRTAVALMDSARAAGRDYARALAADSLTAWGRTAVEAGDAGRAVVVAGDDASMPPATAMIDAVTRAVTEAGAREPRLPVVVVRHGTRWSLWGRQPNLPYTTSRVALLPNAAGRPCIVNVAPGDTTPSLGPCQFLAAFGVPGAGIRAWLDDTRWQSAAEAAWWRREPNRARRPLGDIWSRTAADLLIAERGDELRACTERQLGACGRFALLGGSFFRRRSADRVEPGLLEQTINTSIIIPALDDDGRWRGDLWETRRSMFVSDLVRHLGPERFRAWWTSPLPPDAAYEAVTGGSFDDYAARWLGAPAEALRLPRGSAMPPASFAWAGLFALLGLGIRRWQVARREV